jgi:hypothetical protein
MLAPRLHSLTKILLAVLYGLVGVTGETLHYLTTDPAAIWTCPPSAEVVVYYHTHGPDYHGHFHRHVHHGDHSHAPPVAAAESHEEDHGPAVGLQQVIHESHACPLLTLVSSLKLSNAGSWTTVIILNALVTATFERDRVCEFAAAFSSSARGPPAGNFA